MCFLGLSTMSLGMRAASVQKDSRRTKLELSKDRDLGEMSQFVCLPSNAEVAGDTFIRLKRRKSRRRYEGESKRERILIS